MEDYAPRYRDRKGADGPDASVGLEEIHPHWRDDAGQYAYGAAPRPFRLSLPPGFLGRRDDGYRAPNGGPFGHRDRRVAGRLLARVLSEDAAYRQPAREARPRFRRGPGQWYLDEPTVQAAPDALEIDPRGLDETDRRILRTIIESSMAARWALRPLPPRGGEEMETLEDVIEPFLLQEALIERTPRGRIVTAAGYRHLGLPEPARLLALDRTAALL